VAQRQRAGGEPRARDVSTYRFRSGDGAERDPGRGTLPIVDQMPESPRPIVLAYRRPPVFRKRRTAGSLVACLIYGVLATNLVAFALFIFLKLMFWFGGAPPWLMVGCLVSPFCLLLAIGLIRMIWRQLVPVRIEHDPMEVR